MSEYRTIHDPFLGKDVQISDNLTDRLRGKYANGPMLPNGEPEFGWRQFDTPPIQHLAADRIDALVKALSDLVEAEALSGVRTIVYGWNGEGRDEPYQHRHPDKLGATLPKTTCGAVYALDEALQRARAVLAMLKEHP